METLKPNIQITITNNFLTGKFKQAAIHLILLSLLIDKNSDLFIYH